jgi:hypothetical protein
LDRDFKGLVVERLGQLSRTALTEQQDPASFSEINRKKIQKEIMNVVFGKNLKVVFGKNLKVVFGKNLKVVFGKNLKVVFGKNLKVVFGKNLKVVIGKILNIVFSKWLLRRISCKMSLVSARIGILVLLYNNTITSMFRSLLYFET